MSHSAFGIDHGDISKAENSHKKEAVAVGATGAAGVGVAAGTKMPEHSHYSRKTRKYLKSLPAGEHEVDTKILMHKPRKLGARKQQTPYVAAMAQERPYKHDPERPHLKSFDESPVPITRYKDGVIQRDNAHSVMANAMKNRKTKIKIEDAGGYRPSRRTGEELVRRAQSRYQQHRLKGNTNLSDKKIESIRGAYTDASRKANTAKRPHGAVEEGFRVAKKPFGIARALSFAKKDSRHDVAAGAVGAAGVGTLGATPVRRSAVRSDVSGGRMKASDAKRMLNPGYRPGNKRAIRTMAANLGHLENKPTSVIRYKDGSVIPFDGNHRGTARIARGDKSIPVKVIEGKERPAVSVTRNAYHSVQQKVHHNRMDRNVFKPTAKTGRHAGQTKTYGRIANASPSRSGSRVAVEASRFARGPSKAMLRTKQGATIATGAALLGTAEHLHRKGKS